MSPLIEETLTGTLPPIVSGLSLASEVWSVSIALLCNIIPGSELITPIISELYAEVVLEAMALSYIFPLVGSDVEEETMSPASIEVSMILIFSAISGVVFWLRVDLKNNPPPFPYATSEVPPTVKQRRDEGEHGLPCATAHVWLPLNVTESVVIAAAVIVPVKVGEADSTKFVVPVEPEISLKLDTRLASVAEVPNRPPVPEVTNLLAVNPERVIFPDDVIPIAAVIAPPVETLKLVELI